MTINNISINISNSGKRNQVRTRVVNEFLKELPGNGSGANVSKYNYFVKTLNNKNEVVLTRPANLKNGFDFLIRVPQINFNIGGKRKRDYPKHDDILNDLVKKKNEDKKMYARLYNLIQKIYACVDVADNEMSTINFKTGYPTDLIIHVIKWFFIEQDIRYWNYSGRTMFMRSVPDDK